MSEPEKGWQPPPVGEPSKEALEAAEVLATQLPLIEAVPLEPGQWNTITITHTAFANPKATLALALEAYAAARVAEAGAQEREPLVAALKDAFFWLTSGNATQTDHMACADRVRRALAEPQEQT